MADKNLQSMTFPQLENKYLVPQIDGYHEEMTVGTAENLIGTQLIEERVPYLYRQSGGGANIGNREYDKIVGGSVVWNQNYRPHTAYIKASSADITGLTISFSNGYINVTGTPENDCAIDPLPVTFDCPANHVCLLMCDGADGTFTWSRGGFSNNTTGVGAMNKHTIKFGTNARIKFTAGTTYNIHARFMTFDLTVMFGTTIADYIYNLEQSTAGAGVALFRKLFPNDYYEYNAGEMKHVGGVSEHKMVGFNQWDGTYTSGPVIQATTGNAIGSFAQYAVTNYIKVLPNTSYFINTTGIGSSANGMAWYDKDKNYISGSGYTNPTTSKAGTFTSPSNAMYMRATIVVASIDTFCINISSSRNGEYEPYQKHTYALDSSLTLRGIPKLDASNNIYWDGDTYEADGTVTRKYGIVDLGTLNWERHATYTNCFYAQVSSLGFKTPTSRGYAGVCSKYQIVTGVPLTIDVITNTSKAMFLSPITWSSTNPFIIVNDDSYTSASAFKSAMSGVYLVYELATPTTETAEPFHNPQTVDPYGTEEYVSTSIVPVGHSTKYSQNLTAKIEGLPWNFATLIAPTETAYKATRNYTTGSLFIVENILYKATANIANGGTITPNTNCTSTTLAEVISALS